MRKAKGEIRVFGETSDHMLEQFARIMIEKWINERGVLEDAEYLLRLFFLRCPDRSAFDWAGCEIELQLNGRKYVGRHLAANARSAVRGALERLRSNELRVDVRVE